MRKIISKLLIVNCQLSISSLREISSLIVFVALFSLLTTPIYAQPSSVGSITRPQGIPSAANNVQGYVTNLIATGIRLLLVVTFIAAFVYLLLAGLKFITSGGDPKAIEGARSQITWGIIGLVVVLCAYAILRVVEVFFGVNFLSGPFQMPRF